MAIKLCFVDVETINVNRNTCGIFQIAAVMVEYDENSQPKVLDKINLTMSPPMIEVVDESAIEHAHVSLEQIYSYKPSKEVFEEFQHFLSKHVDKFLKKDKCFLVAYNAAFDSNKIRNWFTQNNNKYYGSWFWSNTICVMQFASFVFRYEREEFPNFKLGTVCTALNIPLDKAHDAMSDVIATIGLYEILERSLLHVEDIYKNEITDG